MTNAIRRTLFVMIAGMGFLGATAFADVTVSITISGTVDELAPVLQHLKDMGIGLGKGAASAPADGAKTEIHSSMTAPAPAGPALTAQNLVGTVWEAGGHKLAFNADGKLKVNDSVDGTWSIAGDTLKISAMGQDMAVTIAGDKLLFQGRPLTKVGGAPAAPAAPAPAAPAAPAGAPLDAKTLVGTTWEGGGYTTVFNADGKLKVNDNMDGTWKVEGNKVKIAVSGEDVEVEIQGDKLMYEGQPLKRVQPKAAAAPAPAPATPGAALNAQTLVGSKWEGGGYVSVFNADGKLRVNDSVDGTWKVEGDKVKISVGGQDLELGIKGDKLTYKDQPLNRQ